jgi:hypothetical protein
MRTSDQLKSRGFAAALFFLLQLTLGAQVVSTREKCVCAVYQAIADQEYRRLKSVGTGAGSSVRTTRKWYVHKSKGSRPGKRKQRISRIDRCTHFR